MTYPLKRLFDPLYGLLVPDQHEWNLLFCPEVQRLRQVRLCNINSLLVPGASEVMRFEHSLGVLRLAKEWLACHKIPRDEAEDLSKACILHDIYTGPFGHTAQYIFEDNALDGEFRHEDLDDANSRMYHQITHANVAYAGSAFQASTLCGDRWANVSDLIRGRGRLGALVSGSIDFDNIDNVFRLAFHAGLCEREDALTALGLARDMEPASDCIVVSANGVEMITRWQAVRRRLYEFLLLDWAEFSAKAMLTRAFEDAVKMQMIGLDSWRLTDEEMIQHLQSGSVGDAQAVEDMLRRLRLGDLYTPLVMARSSSVGAYKELAKIEVKRKIESAIRDKAYEKEIEKATREKGYEKKCGPSFLVHFILDVRKTDRAINVQLRDTGKEMTLGTDSRSLLVGVFTNAPVVPLRDAERAASVALSILADSGCAELIPLDDPMGAGPRLDPQLRLFK